MDAELYEHLLTPISDDAPCGPDNSLQPEFLELETLMKGKEETQFSKAVKPDWPLVYKHAVEIFEESKHLEVATALCLAILQTRGLVGLAGALDFLDRFVEQYWPTMHPQLDPDDHNDPLERMNILASLSMPVGTFGDSFQFLQRLAEAPLAASPQLGKLSFADCHRDEWPDPDHPEAIDPTTIAATFRDTPGESITETYQALQDCKAAIGRLAKFLDETIGVEKACDFRLLNEQLDRLAQEVTPYLPADTAAADPNVSDAQAALAQAVSGPGIAISGELQSRQDVIASLDKICTYYEKHEPGSPIPLLLKRARRLVQSDFLTIVNDLAPDALGQMRNATGVKEEESE